MTLKEKLTYSFMAISIALGSNACAADAADSALFGSTSGAPNTRLPQSSADSALFDPEAFKSGVASLLSTRRPQEKTAISHAESMHLSDAPLTSVSSSSSLSSAAAADKSGVFKESDDGAEQAAEGQDGMSASQATHLLGSLFSGFLPGAHLQVSKVLSHTEKSSGGSGTRYGLSNIFNEDEGAGRGESHRDDRHGTRREDHHGDTHTLARRGVFQEPLGESRRDDSDVPDLLGRKELGRSSSGYPRTDLSSRVSQQEVAFKERIKFSLLMHGRLLELDFMHLARSFELILSNDSFETLEEAGNMCTVLLKNYCRLINDKKGKSEDAAALYEKRTNVMEYIRTKVTHEMSFIPLLLDLMRTERFQIISRISTEDPDSLLNLKVQQAVLTPIANVLVRTVNLSEYARIESIVNEFLISNEKLVRAELVHKLGKTSRRGEKIQEDLNRWLLGLIGIPQALSHPSHSAVVQEKDEKKVEAKPKTDQV